MRNFLKYLLDENWKPSKHADYSCHTDQTPKDNKYVFFKRDGGFVNATLTDEGLKAGMDNLDAFFKQADKNRKRSARWNRRRKIAEFILPRKLFFLYCKFD